MLNDYHVHSNESDGQLSPEQLIDAAKDIGVSAIALCDHDTTAGGRRFAEYGRKRGVKAIAGIEMSAKWKGGNCHLLGLSVSDCCEPLEDVLRKTRESRDERNGLIIEKLAQLGVPICADQLRSEAGGEVVARPHIARALIKAGYVESIQEAFAKYLSQGKPAYVDRFRLAPEEAIKLLREAGAFTVLAHPRQLNVEDSKLFELISNLKDAGLQGVEVFSPDTTDEQINLYKEIATELDLTITGGSDFHSTGLSGREIGYYRPGVAIPEIFIPVPTSPPRSTSSPL